MDLFAQRRQELQERQDRTRAWVVAGVLLLLILALVGFLYSAMSQDRDILRGDEFYEKQRFQDALGYYLRSEGRNSIGSRPRLTYRIATCYERLGQIPRAGDYFIRLTKEASPGSEWHRRGLEGLRNLVILDATPVPGTGGGSSTSLVQAKHAWHKSYNRVVLALRENRAGVSVELEQAYQEYKRNYETYVREIQQGLRRLDSEGI